MAYGKETPFPKLLIDAAVLPLFDGGNFGIRRRQLEYMMIETEYIPWKTTF